VRSQYFWLRRKYRNTIFKKIILVLATLGENGMVSSLGMSEGHRQAPPNIYQRRAYAARRALVAIDKYTSLAFTDKSAADKERALRWMKAWLAFAVGRER
jgi:hypothetical protein